MERGGRGGGGKKGWQTRLDASNIFPLRQTRSFLVFVFNVYIPLHPNLQQHDPRVVASTFVINIPTYRGSTYRLRVLCGHHHSYLHRPLSYFSSSAISRGVMAVVFCLAYWY